MTTLKRLAILSVHTSPLAPMGGKKTGGMNVYIRDLAQELGRQGIEVDVFTRRSSPDEPEIDYRIGYNVRVIYLTAGGVRALSPDDIFPYLPEFTAKLMAFATLRNVQYDIVYSHYWLSGWVAQKLKEAWGVPFVQMFHTLGQMKQRIISADTLFLPDQRVHTEMDIAQWADRVVAATPAEHAQLMWLYRAKRRKIEIVPPGVDVQRFKPVVSRTKANIRARLGFDKRHLLLFVGRIEPLKGIDTILQAMALLRENAPGMLQETQFALVGGDPRAKGDPEMERIQQMVVDFDLSENVTFLGAKDQSQLPEYYNASTAVIMPSDYESFGMVALEAMASGVPVIASAVGGLAFLVRDGETGYHVPVREPKALAARICCLLDSEERREHMGRMASHVANDYAWSNIAARLIDIFGNILSSRTKQVV